MNLYDQQYVELIELLVGLSSESAPSWKAISLGHGYEFELGDGGSIMLTDLENKNRSQKGFAISIVGQSGRRWPPFIAYENENPAMFKKMAVLFQKTAQEANSKENDLSSVIQQVRSMVH